MASIRFDELGEPMPAGIDYEKIPSFPTPGSSIKRIVDPQKRRMLQRIYFEYRYLCSFSHGLPPAHLFKVMFNSRQPLAGRLFSSSQRQDTWQRAVAERSFNAALLGAVQAAAELTTLYPGDVDLRAAAVKPWEILANGTLLSQAVWEIRTRKLLGVVEPDLPNGSGMYPELPRLLRRRSSSELLDEERGER